MIGNELLGISDAQEVTLCSPPKPTCYAWGKWNLKKEWRENLKGEGITIAILDTGIYRSHDAFKPDDEFVQKISALSKNFCNGDEDDINDEDGHGTACAGIAAGMPFSGYLGGVAPGAELIVCKVVAKRDEVKIKTILKALKYLEEVSKRNTINVVSMSLGFPESDNPTLNQQKNMRDLRTTIKRLQNMGIICVAAAGNGGTHPENHPVFSPAKFDGTIAVGAHDTLWNRSKFSPSSPEVDFTTLGEEVCTKERRREGIGLYVWHLNGDSSSCWSHSMHCSDAAAIYEKRKSRLRFRKRYLEGNDWPKQSRRKSSLPLQVFYKIYIVM